MQLCFSLCAVIRFSLFAVIRSPSWGSSGVAGPASHTASNIQVQLGILMFLAWCGYDPLGAGSSLSADFMIPCGGGPLRAGGSSLCVGKNAHCMDKKSL